MKYKSSKNIGHNSSIWYREGKNLCTWVPMRFHLSHHPPLLQRNQRLHPPESIKQLWSEKEVEATDNNFPKCICNKYFENLGLR
jgi:hypothetical protein